MPCPNRAHAVLCRGLEKSLSERHGRSTEWARHGHGMANVNLTLPHCVNQMGKTQYKPLAARHVKGTACYVWISLYYVHNRPPSIPALSRINPVDAFPSCFKRQFNIIPLLTPMSSSRFLFFRFTLKYTVWISLFPCVCHVIWFNHINTIWWGVKLLKLLIMQYSAASCTSSILGTDVPKYPVLEPPQSVLFAQCEIRNFTRIQNKNVGFNIIRKNGI